MRHMSQCAPANTGTYRVICFSLKEVFENFKIEERFVVVTDKPSFNISGDKSVPEKKFRFPECPRTNTYAYFLAK